MKQFHVSLFTFCIALVCISINASSTETFSFNYSESPVVRNDLLELPGVNNRLTAVGGYSLPMDQQTIQFPVGTTIESCEVTEITTASMKLKRPLGIIKEMRVSKQIVNVSSKSYKIKDSDVYPDRWFDLELRQGLNAKTLQPTLFVTCRVFPVRATATTADYLKSLNIEITARRPEKTPSRDTAALLVIAPEVFSPTLQSFSTHKASMGITTVIRTVEDIEANETGRDLQEKIKYAIDRAYTESSVRYVILAGDASQIPVRYGCNFIWHQFEEFEHVPADIYYADLYDYTGAFCDWDYNENNLFGQFKYGPGNPDRCDFAPDVMLGRLPVNTTDELSTVLNKIIQYESTVTGSEDWTNRIVFAAADTFNINHSEYTGIPEGEYNKEQIAADFLQEFDLIKLYETEKYARTDALNESTLIAAINNGAAFVNFANHGYSTGWQLPNDYFEDSSVAQLTNSTMLPVVFAHACLTAQFDCENPECPDYGYVDKCIGETMLLHPTGGCIAYFGASRSAMAGGRGIGDNTGALGMVDYTFYEGLHDGHSNLGRLHVHAVNSLLFERGIDTFKEFLTLLEFVCLGDPSQSVGGSPANPDFELTLRGYDDSTGGNADGCFNVDESVELLVEIGNDGIMESNLTAELTLNDPDLTIITGTLSLPDFPRGFRYSMTPGFRVSLSGTATVNRKVPVQITLMGDTGTYTFNREIYIGPNAYLDVDRMVMTSDDNGDRHAGQGENLQLAPDIHNSGCVTADDIVGTIVINDSYITDYGVRDTGELPPIEPGATRVPLKLYYASIPPNTPHGHVFTCQVTLHSPSSAQTWEYDLPVQVYDFTPPEVLTAAINPCNPEPGDQVTVTAEIADGAGVESVELQVNSFELDASQNHTMYDDGNHGDGQKNDGVFGVQFSLIDQPAFYACDFIAKDGLDNSGTSTSALRFTSIPFEKNDSILIVSAAENDYHLGLYCQALTDAGYGYDIWSWWRGVPPIEVLNDYIDGAVIWFYSHRFPILEAPARNAISSYLDSGGNLLLTEQDVGFALVDSGTAETEQWCRETLCFEYQEDDSTLRTIIGLAGDPVSDTLEFSLDGGSGAHNQTYPSLIDAVEPGQGCFFYKDYSGPYTGCAGLRAEQNGSRLIFMAFGFEGISSQTDRRDVIRKSMEWLGVSSSTSVCPWNQSPGWWMGPELLPLNSRIQQSTYYDPTHRIYHNGGRITTDEPGGTGRAVDKSVYFIDTETGEAGDTGFDIAIARFDNVCATLDSRDGPWIYFLGGYDLEINLIRESERMNPMTGAVEILASDPMPQSISGKPLAWVIADNKVYITGTIAPAEPYSDNRTWVFDPLAEPGSRWMDINAPFNEHRVGTTIAALNHQIYAMGGVVWTGSDYVESLSIETLDLTMDTPHWVYYEGEAPLRFAYARAIGIQSGSNVDLENTILITGGYDEYVNPTWIFRPDDGTWKQTYPTNCNRRMTGPLLYIPSSRGGEIWTTHSYNQSNYTQDIWFYCSTEIFHLGSSHRDNWIGIRANQDMLKGGCTLTVNLDISGDDAGTPVDCYVVLETSGIFMFLTTDPLFPTFTLEPFPFFQNAPLPVSTTYCGPLFEIPLPLDIPSLDLTMYAATLHSGTSELAGGLTWDEVRID